MRALGMPYRPVPQPAPPIPDPGLGPVAWAERWGFGVTTSVGVRPVAEVADPNAAYAAALPPDAAVVYRTALFGTDGASGCHGAANEQVHGLRARLLAPLDADLAALGRAVDADAAMIAVRDSWSACIRPAADALALAGSDRDRDRLPDALIAAFAGRLRALRPSSTGPPTLGALQAFERRTAVRIARCEAAFAAGRAVVAAAHESRFVREHTAALAAIGRSIRDAEAALPDEPP